jgi:glutathione S-transferase
MRIFHRKGAGRPMRVAWTLEELGVPYDVSVVSSEAVTPEHRARHPLGRVPVLDDGEGYVFESAAICLHLADMNAQAGLVPALGTRDRALVYQWTIFAPAELEPALIETVRYAERDPERSASARKRFDTAAGAVSNALGDRDYLVGGRFTVADVLVGSALRFTVRGGFADELPSNLIAYIQRLTQRPAFQRAAERISSSEQSATEVAAAASP